MSYYDALRKYATKIGWSYIFDPEVEEGNDILWTDPKGNPVDDPEWLKEFTDKWMAGKEDEMPVPHFHFAIGRPSQSDSSGTQVSFYTYCTQIHYGTMDDAKKLLEYCEVQRGIDDRRPESDYSKNLRQIYGLPDTPKKSSVPYQIYKITELDPNEPNK